MKMQIKKILALVLAAVMCLGVMAGCNIEDEDDTVITKPSIPVVENKDFKNSETYPLDSDKTYDITIAKSVDDFNSFDCVTRWEEVTGVETDFTALSGEAYKLAVTTGDFGDAVLYSSQIDRAKWNEMGMEGRFVNFLDYIEYMPNFALALERYPEVIDAIVAPDGGVYSLPRIGTTSTAHDALYVRTDYLKAAGWEELPQTTDELMECLGDLKAYYGANNPDFYPLSAHSKNYIKWNAANGLLHFLFPSFGDLMDAKYSVDANNKIVFGASTEQYKRLLTYVNQMLEAGYMEFGPDIYSEDGTNATASNLAGNIAMSTYASYMTTAQFASGELDMTLLSPLTSQWQSEKRFDPVASVVWQNNGINATLPEEDIIVLAKWFDSFYAFQDNPLNEEGTIWGISFWLGELNKDFTIDEDAKTYTILDHEGYESGSLWATANSVGGNLGLFGTEDWMYVQESNTGLEIKGIGTIENTMPYAVDRFRVDWLLLTESESETYADNWTNIFNYVTEWTAKFVAGDYDIEDKWDEYLDGLDSMGVYEVQEAYQAAYDRYLAQ